MPEFNIHRRVTGHHNLRLDGIGDLVCRASGASVLDLGCNRGMACYEFAGNGASLVHGCDINEEVIFTARSIFADVPNVNYRFEVVDLAKGPKALDAAFSNIKYDIILLLAIYHKLKRVADPRELLFNVARRCNKYIGWRGYSEELSDLEEPFKACGFKRIQYSEISESICPAAIWRRG